MRATMEISKKGFVKYHLPCPLCKSSDAVSVNADSSAYCFSCQKYIKEYDMETQPITNGKQESKMQNFIKVIRLYRNSRQKSFRKYL